MNKTIKHLKRRAEELRRQTQQASDRINAMNEVAWELRDTDVSLAAQISREALQLALRNDYGRGRAFALRCLGVCQINTDQYKEAAETLAESCAVFTDLGSADTTELASTINLAGVTQKFLGDHQAALESCSTALNLCEGTTASEQTFFIYRNIANIYTRTGDYSMAISYYYQALPVYNPVAMTLPEARIYGCLSDLLWRMGEAKTAIEHSQQIISLFQKHQDRKSEAVALVNLGAAQQSIGDKEKAAESYWRSIAIAQADGYLEMQAEAFRNIGALFLEQDNPKNALTYFTQALQLARSVHSLYDESEALLFIGTAYEQLGNEKESVEMLEKALEISEQLNLKEVRAKVHRVLSKVFEKQGKTAAALSHHQLFQRFWQDVFGGTSFRQIEHLLLQKSLGAVEGPDIQLLRQSATPNLDLPIRTRAALAPHKLRLIVEFINQNLDQHIVLATLADIVSLNHYHFIRSFKHATGRTPHQFLLERRIERAKILLQTTSLPLAEIALSCGFNSQPHFTTQFRLSTGNTPHQFRKSA